MGLSRKIGFLLIAAGAAIAVAGIATIWPAAAVVIAGLLIALVGLGLAIEVPNE